MQLRSDVSQEKQSLTRKLLTAQQQFEDQQREVARLKREIESQQDDMSRSQSTRRILEDRLRSQSIGAKKMLEDQTLSLSRLSSPVKQPFSSSLRL